MTTPPQGEHEQHPDGQPADDRAGAWPDDDPHATRPAPAWEPPRPGPGSEYGQGAPPAGTPFYGPPGSAVPQQYGQPQYGPPQYPAPQYGQQGQFGHPAYGPPPYGPPARKSRAGVIAAVVGGVLLLAAVVVALVLTQQTTVLDRAAVERDVAAQFEEREGVALDLECAEEMTVDEGATYACTGTTDQGEDVTLRIAITDEQEAAYTWGAP